ncbi:MAG: transcription elongation factor GreA [Candidatus Portnoybacteria bacterium CG06_land_8_20_14_3_00_39_12]|uniref:Transcription elongation factor GreA n=2 Tax=Candidatus Portnoyibacteriota TaxID=1817913 RepID=A0A2M7UJW7_9BACT|nr:MAG: transcription elongation factor GreA [Candidatus Portnoybacteria bacterium CG06_land_8_20_14_3_00_39_12]PIZ71534.1 MAG: transcription elongation factor GreA [Candidatus Portnoybacteria bacterium CG_4_10_14_0_2_um_filter_39_11]
MEYLTKQGLEKLKQELEERKKKRQDIAKRLEEVKALGDLSENVEYAQTKDEQSFNEGRVAELENIVSRARVYEGGGGQIEQVGIGSTVAVALKIGGKINKKLKREFSIVGSQEAEPMKGRISLESPIGKALMGHKLNDEVNVDTPKGRQKYVIIKIS